MSLPGKRSQSRESTLKRNSPCSVIMSWLYLITDSVSDISRIFLPTSAPFCPTRLRNEGEKESCPSAHCQSAHVCPRVHVEEPLFIYFTKSVYFSLIDNQNTESHGKKLLWFWKAVHINFESFDFFCCCFFLLISTIRDKHKWLPVNFNYWPSIIASRGRLLQTVQKKPNNLLMPHFTYSFSQR